MTYLYLIMAIAFEVLATSLLKETQNFTRLLPSLMTLAGYGAAFFFLSLTLRALPVGVVYAIWSGAGIVFISAIGWIWFRQALDAPTMIGMGLIVTGVGVINLFSKATPH